MGTGRDVDAKDNGFKVILKSHLNYLTPAITRFFHDFDVQTIKTLTNLVNRFLYRKQIQLYKVFELIVRHTNQRSRQEN